MRDGGAHECTGCRGSRSATLTGATLAVTGVADVEVIGVPESARAVMRNDEVLSTLRPGVLVPGEAQPPQGLTDGVRVDVIGPRGTRSLTVAVDKRLGFAYTMTSGDSSALGGEARKDTLLLRLTDGADLTATLGKVAALARGAHATVGRSAPQREKVHQIITALVAGLLAMSVLIALVGVGNTLALSVHERRRESALLRALGVTRGQVKGMLALEGLLLAGVGTVLGVPLGVAYGLAGARGLPGLSDIPSSIVVPVGPLGAVGGVALLAGLIASVLPGRRAARVAPAAAIALA